MRKIEKRGGLKEGEVNNKTFIKKKIAAWQVLDYWSLVSRCIVVARGRRLFKTRSRSLRSLLVMTGEVAGWLFFGLPFLGQGLKRKKEAAKNVSIDFPLVCMYTLNWSY